MKINDEVFVHGYIDEIRKDAVIVKNEGGYFGTDPQEIKDVLDFTPCQVVDARTDKAYQDGYNKGFADGRKDVLNSEKYVSKATYDKRIEETYKEGDKHGYERACDEQGYVSKSTFDAAMSQHEKWAHDDGVEDGINEYANALLTVSRWGDIHRANMFDGDIGMQMIIRNHDPKDIILAVRADEKEEASRFVVGDEIEAGDGKLRAVVTRITDDEIEYVDKDGYCHASKNKSICKRTGFHYDGMAEILEKMRGKDVKDDA